MEYIYQFQLYLQYQLLPDLDFSFYIASNEELDKIVAAAKNVSEIEDAIGEEITLHDDQVRKLYNFISELKEKAQDGEIYRKDLKKEVVRLCSIAQPDIESEIMGTVADKMTLEELKSFKKSFEAGASNIIPQKPQLMSNKNLSEKVKGESKNTQFKI